MWYHVPAHLCLRAVVNMNTSAFTDMEPEYPHTLVNDLYYNYGCTLKHFKSLETQMLEQP